MVISLYNYTCVYTYVCIYIYIYVLYHVIYTLGPPSRHTAWTPDKTYLFTIMMVICVISGC